jgi:hypothetical protein
MMYGIDVETTALDPADGKLRLLQLSDGEEVLVYDAFKQPIELLTREAADWTPLVAHNAPSSGRGCGRRSTSTYRSCTTRW